MAIGEAHTYAFGVQSSEELDSWITTLQESIRMSVIANQRKHKKRFPPPVRPAPPPPEGSIHIPNPSPAAVAVAEAAKKLVEETRTQLKAKVDSLKQVC